MAYKTLAAIALAATVAASAAHADTTYQNDNHFSVWMADDPVACHFKEFQPTQAGYAGFGIALGYYPDGRETPMMFAYQEKGFNWTASGKVTVQIGGFTPWAFDMKADGSDQLTLWNPVGGQVKRFIGEFMAGQSMTISTGSGTRVFSLAGSTAAIQSFARCLGDLPGGRASNIPAAVDPRGPVTRF